MGKKNKKEKQIVDYELKEFPCTPESIIKRLIDEKLINGEEAIILIKELCQNSRITIYPNYPKPIAPYYKFCIWGKDGLCEFPEFDCINCPKKPIITSYKGDTSE